MTFHDFLVNYLLFLLLASLVIIGFYIITRGKRKQLPDGSVKLEGKIFKQWSLYWERTIGTQRLYYRHDELRKKYQWLKECNAGLSDRLSIDEEGNSMQIGRDISPEEYSYLRDLLQCQIEISGQNVLLYDDDPVYYWPEWLRFPLSQCPPCMASVYGTLLYWPLFMLVQNAFTWTNFPVMAIVFFWVVFMTGLAALNKLFYNIIGV